MTVTPADAADHADGAVDTGLSDVVPARDGAGDDRDPERDFPDVDDCTDGNEVDSGRARDDTDPEIGYQKHPDDRLGTDERDNGVTADLTLAPSQDRPGLAARGKRRARHRRERDGAPARQRSRSGLPRRRRSKATSLALTLVMAFIVLGAGGAAGFLLDLSGRFDLGLVKSRVADAVSRPPGEVRVSAEEGWVGVPLDGQAVTVTADGPFRVRFDGTVYTLEDGRTMRIPAVSGATVQVRAASPSTVARVTPVE